MQSYGVLVGMQSYGVLVGMQSYGVRVGMQSYGVRVGVQSYDVLVGMQSYGVLVGMQSYGVLVVLFVPWMKCSKGVLSEFAVCCVSHIGLPPLWFLHVYTKSAWQVLIKDSMLCCDGIINDNSLNNTGHTISLR